MFFVLEGIDGAGCGIQRVNIEKILKEKGKDVATLKFPFYENPIGQMIKSFLKEGKDLSIEMQFLLFSSQMIFEKEKIASLRKDRILISDHYFTTTLCYQGINGIDYQKGLRYAKDFGLELPDAIFYLDTPPKIAKSRKLKEDGKEKLDRYEENFSFSEKTDKFYRKLAKEKVLADWIFIDNTKSIDEVSTNIIEIIENFRI